MITALISCSVIFLNQLSIVFYLIKALLLVLLSVVSVIRRQQYTAEDTRDQASPWSPGTFQYSLRWEYNMPGPLQNLKLKCESNKHGFDSVVATSNKMTHKMTYKMTKLCCGLQVDLYSAKVCT
jgi:hypothetical protein